MTSNRPGPFVYRILSYRHVVDWFKTGEIRFSSPSVWEDPFEQTLDHRRSRALFAQCWCSRAVSDAMWRIYSPDRTGLRIRARRSAIGSALRAAQEDKPLDFHIGDVEYLPTRSALRRVGDVATDLDSDFQIRRAFDAMLVKRDAFDHESEVRIVVHDRTVADYAPPKASFRVPVDPYQTVDSIMFDPRADGVFLEMCSHYLQTKLDVKCVIQKSGLYRISELHIV